MTMVGVPQACSHLGTLQRGKWIHEQVLQANMDISIHLGAALITMYARCGSINDARRTFDGMPERDLLCWTAIICGYGMHGLTKDAEVLFNEIVASGVKPDGVAFLHGSMLAIAGRLDEALEFIGNMDMKHDAGVASN
ncbi:pentatricopeptide repeat-containing protein At2g42920, chloroplastic-like [Zingiber officinale]|uniref:pentatricopeptide repeat-containing protein At2g42920, chloroplastic-like n=1 Tax=Zingiber officinale TaxID=94328 RepID=UPI001C4A87D1|nr:pentatricopeptide repeat-containing protein At2g42920, chloroplastic-like [Zingiber officinale]